MEKTKNLPIIDWDEAIRIAGHQKDLARDILNMLARELPKELDSIQALHKAKNYPDMLRSVHKLHGAVCYAGTPRLKSILSTLETNLKTNIMDDSSSLLVQLDVEVGQLLEHLSNMKLNNH